MRRTVARRSYRSISRETQGVLDEGAARCGGPRDRALWQLTLDYGIAYHHWELEWLEQAMERLIDLPPGADRAENDENDENGGNG